MKLRRPGTHYAVASGRPQWPVPGPLARLYEWRSAITAGSLAALFIVGRFILVPIWRGEDTRGVRDAAGVATVLSKATIPGKYSTGWYLTFRVGDRATTMQVNDIEKWTLTNQGDTVPVTYRVGKSGILYVDDWELPERRPAR